MTHIQIKVEYSTLFSHAFLYIFSVNYMYSQGLLDRWQQKHWPYIPSCETTGAPTLSLYHLQGSFYILGSCMLVATLTLLAELIAKKTRLDKRLATVFSTFPFIQFPRSDLP